MSVGLLLFDFIFQLCDVVELVLHHELTEFETACFCHDFSDDASESFPFFFLSFSPVVLPEVIIGRKDRQLMDSLSGKATHAD